MKKVIIVVLFLLIGAISKVAAQAFHSIIVLIVCLKRSLWQLNQKKELLSRETYSRTPINYSEGMADDQKDRYIQYFAEQH